MCKSIKNEFDKHLSFEKLYSAYERAVKNKKHNKERLLFELDLESNLYNLYRELKHGTYKSGKYREFTIYEPKERLIKSLPFRDRIVHEWYIEEFIKPYFIPRFISDTYACIPGRGTHKASYKLKHFNKIMYKKYKNFYFIKCDIKKFFYNIDKNILYNILKKRIKDKKLLNLTKKLIFDKSGEGLPIGNYTSQYFANIYLSELDYYIKYDLNIKYYLRYMDDFVMLVPSKKIAKLYLEKIEIFINNKLHLELNLKSRIIPNYLGIDFCGYFIKRNKVYIRKNTLKRFNKKIIKWKRLYKLDKLDIKKLISSINSYSAHVKHSDTVLNLNIFSELT